MSEQTGLAAPAKGAEEESESAPVATVAGTVLSAFFDALEMTDDLHDQAAKLRRLVLEDNVMAEPAIRAILIPEAP